MAHAGGRGSGYPPPNAYGQQGMDGVTAAMGEAHISPPTPQTQARKGLMIVDPTNGEEVKVEPKSDGRMTRMSNGKGDGKGGGRGRGRGNSRQSTIGGRAVTTIGGKQMKMSYAMYDPTSNDYEDSPKSSPSPAPSPAPTSVPPSSVPPTSAPPAPAQPLPNMPRPYTEPPIMPAPSTSALESHAASQAPPQAPMGMGYSMPGGVDAGSGTVPGAGASSQVPPASYGMSPSSVPGVPDYMTAMGPSHHSGGAAPMPEPYLQQLGRHHQPAPPGDYMNGFSSTPAVHMPYQSPAQMPAPMPSMPQPGMQMPAMQPLPHQNGMHPGARGSPSPGGAMPPAYGMPPNGMPPHGGMPQAPMYPGQPHHYSQMAPVPGRQQQQQQQQQLPPHGAAYHQQKQDHHGMGMEQGQRPSKHQPPPQEEETVEPSKMSKTQLKNQKKHQRARERKAKELREQAEEAVLAWRTSVLAAPLASMGFPRERCYAAVCACSDGKTEVDLERCVAWLLSDQLFKGKNADLDISADVAKMTEIENSGFCRADVERAVLAHGGDVESASRALRNGTFALQGSA